MVKAAKRKKRKASKAKVKRGTWTPELVEDLRGLWAEGIACVEIAARLGGGIDRLSVIRKAWNCNFGPHPAGRGAKKRTAADNHGEGHTSPDSITMPGVSSNKKNDAPSNAVSSNAAAALSSNRNARWRVKHPEQWRAAKLPFSDEQLRSRPNRTGRDEILSVCESDRAVPLPALSNRPSRSPCGNSSKA